MRLSNVVWTRTTERDGSATYVFVILKSPLVAVFTCCQTSDVGSTSEIAWLVFVVSVSVKLEPLLTRYCRPNVSGVSVCG